MLKKIIPGLLEGGTWNKYFKSRYKCWNTWRGANIWNHKQIIRVIRNKTASAASAPPFELCFDIITSGVKRTYSISQKICTRFFALLCFVVVIHWLISPYPSGLLHWHCGNLTIAPVPAKQPWWIWINTSCEIIMNDYITTTKQSTTKPCAYLLGYTVLSSGNWRCCFSLEAVRSIPTWFTIIYRFLCCLHAFSCARLSKLSINTPWAKNGPFSNAFR